MSYQINEGSFDVPEDWHDESVNIFKGPEGEGYNLVISRERIPKAVVPEQHMESRRVLIEENLTSFRERERTVIELDGQPCVWLEYTWKSPDGLMNQVNLLRAVRDMMVSFTFTSARAFTDGQRSLFRRVLESYRMQS